MIRLFVWLCSTIPLACLLLSIYQNDLSADPAKYLALYTGECALIFLLITLSVSTCARLHQCFRVFYKVRRMLGLWSFFWVSVHLCVFVFLYLELDWAELASQFKKHPYICVGLLAWLCMAPLAITSNNYLLKRMGAAKWKRLHRLIYVAVILVVLHVIWQIRANWFDALIYGSLAGLLLLERLWVWRKSRS